MTLDTLFLGNYLSTWLKGVLTALLVWLILTLVRRFTLKTTSRAHKEDGLLYQFTKSFSQITIVVIAIAVLTAFLTLPSQTTEILRIVYIAAAGLQAGIWLTSFIDHWINAQVSATPKGEPSRQSSLTTLGTFIKVVIWIVIVLIIVDNIPNIDLSSMIAGVGLGGIAIGLAAQDVIGDLISSLTISMDKPFVVGDSIQVGDFTGTVEHIGIRSTRLRSTSGEELIISNNDLLSSRVQNFQKMETRRVSFTLSVDYDTPLQKLQRIPDILQEEITKIEKLRFGRAHFKEFSETALQFEVVYSVITPNYDDFVHAQHALNLAIMQRFQQEGIRFGNIPHALKVDLSSQDQASLN